MVTMSHPKPVLERAAADFARSTANPPYVLETPVEESRKHFEALQSGDVPRPAASIEEIALPDVRVRIVRPAGLEDTLPVVLYLHGGGWVLGNAVTYDRLVRELATRAGAAAVFVEYSLAPEARYPVAIEQSYAALQWIAMHGGSHGLDGSRIAVAGDSSGGNMATAVALMATRRSGPAIAAQLLYYPPVDATFGTDSYRHFGTGYWLRRDAMQWFWDQYAPSASARLEVTASPLRASIDQLAGMPRTLLIVGEADVLRDEGEAYAGKMRSAGVAVTAVRYGGIIHDFVTLDALRDTHAARAATAQGGLFLHDALH
jgi:acetyl esterase